MLGEMHRKIDSRDSLRRIYHCYSILLSPTARKIEIYKKAKMFKGCKRRQDSEGEFFAQTTTDILELLST
jgi:hypothetical protein